MRITNVILSLTTALSLVATAGCSKKNKSAEVVAPTPAAPAATAEKATDTGKGDASLTVEDADGTAPPAGPIYFEFDSALLTPDSRNLLATFATWAVKHKPRLKIEGHTDERGTTEYNLALGDRRAHAVADYLFDLGVDRSLVQTITYGEERPAQQGDSEAAHAANRRGEVKSN